MSRFDYVKYDQEAMDDQAILKAKFEDLEACVAQLLPGRAQSLIFTKLEEAYMWCGKAIRDYQIARNVSAPLQEERTNG